jgi:hypothetical protein
MNYIVIYNLYTYISTDTQRQEKIREDLFKKNGVCVGYLGDDSASLHSI